MHLTKLELQGFKTFAKKTALSFLPPTAERSPITAVVGPNGSGKCLHGDSKVMLADGRLIPIRSLYEMAEPLAATKEVWDDGFCLKDLPEPLEILSMDPSTLRIQKRPIQSFIKRTSPGFLLHIKTRSGKEIRTTHYHPFFTLKNGWLHTLKAEELKAGIKIATPRILNTDVADESVNESLARFLGYFIAEGRNTKSGQVRFVNADEAMLRDFIAVAESNFHREAHRYSYKTTSDDVILYGKDLCERLEREFGILRDGHSRTKRVPYQLFSAPLSTVYAFLGALFEGDGHVCHKQSGGRTQAYIEYATASPELAQGVTTLLLRMGIVSVSHTKLKQATNSPVRQKRPYTSVFIYGSEQLRHFAQCIHFVGKKQEALERLKTLTDVSNPNLDLVPTAVNLVRETVVASGFQVKPLRGDFPRLAAYNERRCEASRDGLLDMSFLFQDRWEDREAGAGVRQFPLANSDVYWDEITQIEKVPHEDWVYDLCVSQTHNFVAENFIVHNSNLADAIRWVLGEQSLKLLRGKESQDVIFSGSQGKGRAGFAEVSLSLNNEDGSMPIDYGSITITRRLFRDNTSEYLLNESHVRLQDIQLLLAQANVGQRSYSVVGQGMIDHILVSTPQERKAFFDDATGVKPFQLKRHEAVLKLKRTHENLADVEMLLREIEPRLRSLKRQAQRLEQRDEIEQKLHALEADYYGTQWWTLVDQLEAVKRQFEDADDKIQTERHELSTFEKATENLETSDAGDDGLRKLQTSYREVQKRQATNRQQQFETEKEIELTKVRAQSNWAPLSLLKIVEEVEEVVKGLRGLKGLKDAAKILEEIDSVLNRSEKLSKSLQRPNPDDIKPDPKLVHHLKELKTAEGKIQKELEGLEAQIDAHVTQEKTERTELIQMQKTLREKQRQIHLFENRRNELQIDLARYEERQQALVREMNEFMKDRAVVVRSNPPPARGGARGGGSADEPYAEIQRLRYKLELIGGIDPEIMKEYEEIRARHEFLDDQVNDLQKALCDTEKVIVELDEQIEKQSKAVFGKIDREFERYFKVLFGGGSCRLVKLTREDAEEVASGFPAHHSSQSDGGSLSESGEARGVTPDRAFADTGEEERDREDKIAKKLEKHQDPVIGIDIQATPPGKKLKALNLLSGGERALTSIALISAIMAVNPSPFVLLDEVDAALDEANTIRFASILQELSEKSQFIIITHNRTTMEQADVLYGVTMGEEGISNLLSIHLEDAANGATARR